MIQTPDQAARPTGTATGGYSVISERQVPLAETVGDTGGSAADPYTITVSGERIAALIEANPDVVPFRKNDMQVWIPATALAALKLAPEDQFAIRFYVSDGVLSLEIRVNDEPVAIQGVQVGIPWDGRELSVSTESGESVPFRYSQEDGLLIITLPGAGVYLLNAYPPVDAAPAYTEVETHAGPADASSSSGLTTTVVSCTGAGLLGVLWRLLGRRLIRLLDS